MDKAGGPRKRYLGSRWVTGRVRLQRRREIVGGKLKIFTPRKDTLAGIGGSPSGVRKMKDLMKVGSIRKEVWGPNKFIQPRPEEKDFPL